MRRSCAVAADAQIGLLLVAPEASDHAAAAAIFAEIALASGIFPVRPARRFRIVPLCDAE
jgi:hypothetical protein